MAISPVIMGRDEVVDFAAKVESLCDFLLNKIRKDGGGLIGGSDDEKALLLLKDQAEVLTRDDTVLGAEQLIHGLAEALQ